MSPQKLLKKNIGHAFAYSQSNLSPLQGYLLQKGVANYQCIPNYPHRVWPFWLKQQLNQFDKGFGLDNNFVSLINSRHRNWTLLSEPNCNQYAVIDPSGLINIHGKPFSIDFWIGNSDTLFSPSNVAISNQTFDPVTGIVQSSFNISQISLHSNVFFRGLPNDSNLLFTKYSIKNNSEKSIKLSFFIVIRPYDIEGITSIQSINFIQSNAFIVNNQIGLILDQKPDNIVCLPHHEGDVSEHFNKLEMIFDTKCLDHRASAFAEYRLILKPTETYEVSTKQPTLSKSHKPQLFSKKINTFHFNTLLQNFQSFSFQKESEQLAYEIKGSFSDSLEFSCPDTQLEKLFNQQKLYLQQSLGTSQVHQGLYSKFFNSYTFDTKIIESLSKLGLLNDLPSSIKNKKYIYTLFKYVQSKKITPFEVGQWFRSFLYLVQFNHYPIHQIDYNILEKIVNKLCKHLIKYSQTIPLITPKRKCLHYNQSDYFLSDVFGILHSIECLEYICDFKNFQSKKDFSLYKHKLLKSCEDICDHVSHKITSKPVIPITLMKYLSYELVYNLIDYEYFFSNESDRFQNTLSLVQNTLIKKDLLYSVSNPTGFPMIENFKLATLLLNTSPQEGFKILKKCCSLSSSTGTWPESVHPVTLGGSEGEGHHYKVSAIFIDTLLRFIINPCKNHIEFFQGIPDSWYLNQGFSLNNLHTLFGSHSLNITPSDNALNIEINSCFSKRPDYFIFYAPSHYTNIEINGRVIKRVDEVIKVPSNISYIKLMIDS